MNEQRIRDIANQSSTYAEDTVDYYSGIGDDGLTWEAKILKVRDLKFAELMVKECVSIVENSRIEGDASVCLVGATKCKIEQHFGVEQ